MLSFFHCVPCKLRRRALESPDLTPTSRETPLSPAPVASTQEGLLERPQCRATPDEEDKEDKALASPKAVAKGISSAKAPSTISYATWFLVAVQLVIVIFTSYSGLPSREFLEKRVFTHNEVALSEISRVVETCKPAHGSDLTTDASLLSSFFLWKHVFPTLYSSTPRISNLVNQTVAKYQNSLIEASKTCSSLDSPEFFAHLDLWYFSSVDPSFGPPPKPPTKEFIDCIVERLPGGRKYREPKSGTDHLKIFIIGMEFNQILHKLKVDKLKMSTPHPLLLQSDAWQQKINTVYSQAEHFFQGSVCDPGKTQGELCAYYDMQRLLKATHLMTGQPDGPAKNEIKVHTQRLEDFMKRWTKRKVSTKLRAGQGVMDHQLDLIGEAAFVLKAVSCKPDRDLLVEDLVQTLTKSDRRSSAPYEDDRVQQCHSATTIFMGLQPSSSLQKAGPCGS